MNKRKKNKKRCTISRSKNKKEIMKGIIIQEEESRNGKR